MPSIKLKITTPERLALEKEVSQISLPTVDGQITVLPNHIGYISVLAPGIIEAKNEKDEIYHMAISGGFVEFHDNELTILADTAEHAKEIDLTRAQEARARAEEMKAQQIKNLSDDEYANVVGKINKQIARIHLAKKYRPHLIK